MEANAVGFWANLGGYRVVKANREFKEIRALRAWVDWIMQNGTWGANRGTRGINIFLPREPIVGEASARGFVGAY
eukprot:814230-Prorocentrum_minimum.AAC.1